MSDDPYEDMFLEGDDPPETIHILHEGHVLCGAFDGAIPKEWPPFNSWVRPEHAGICSCLWCLEIQDRKEGLLSPGRRWGKSQVTAVLEVVKLLLPED